MTTPASPALAPTRQAYGELQQAYDQFNAASFEGRLPASMITLQREKANIK